ncbi:MAG: DoxX family protein [Actinomycetota bacterium]
MSLVFLIGRIIFSLIFVASGINHVAQPAGAAAVAEGRGIGNARTLTQVAGAIWIVGGVSIILGLFGDLGALLIAGQLVVLGVLIHPFWKETEPEAQQLEMTQFMKNLSMAGGALVIFAMFGGAGDVLDFVITDPVIELDLP